MYIYIYIKMKLVKLQKDPTNKVVREFLTMNDYIEKKKAI